MDPNRLTRNKILVLNPHAGSNTDTIGHAFIFTHSMCRTIQRIFLCIPTNGAAVTNHVSYADSPSKACIGFDEALIEAVKVMGNAMNVNPFNLTILFPHI